MASRRISEHTNALSIPMKWPTGAPVIGGGPSAGERSVSWRRFEPNGAVGVDDALRVPGRSRGEGDQRGRVGVDRHWLVDRFGIQEPLKGRGMRRELIWVGCAHDRPAGSEVTQ